ncbi:MAG: hypothetical protein GTO63_00675 [Anaerolineae bacterium]|nr:hypothetical protein [Anaerolineae bacterium]NIN93520.1 hypothetical protein [Anaerolineae bacterium]NIQ76594.1 hypothetical protein [Anaerolineae bacterium]
MGMNITLTHPEQFDLDPEIVRVVRANAERYGGSVGIVHDMTEACCGADVVYAKNWTSRHHYPPETDRPKLDEMQTLFEKNGHSICAEAKMKLANEDAIYMHCYPPIGISRSAASHGRPHVCCLRSSREPSTCSKGDHGFDHGIAPSYSRAKTNVAHATEADGAASPGTPWGLGHG